MTGAAAGWNAQGRQACPVCQSGEATRQTHDTARVQAWACDRCDSKWAHSVASPRPFPDCLAAAVSLRALAAELLALAEQQAQRDPDRGGRPRGNDDPPTSDGPTVGRRPIQGAGP